MDIRLIFLARDPDGWRNAPMFKELQKYVNLQKINLLEKGTEGRLTKLSISLIGIEQMVSLAVLVPLRLIRVLGALRRYHADIIITNGIEATSYVLLLRKLRLIDRRVKIVRDWNDLIAKMSLFGNPIRRVYLLLLHGLDLLISHIVDALIVVSQYAKQYVISSRIKSAEAIFVLPELIEKSANVLPEDVVEGKNQVWRLVLFGVIRTYHTNSILNAIKAIHICKKRGYDFELHIAGPFEDEGQWERIVTLAKEMSVRVTFYGKYERQSLQNLLKSCHIGLCLLPDADFTRFITTRKLVEMLAAGLPVLCSDLPGLREIGGGACRYCKSLHPEDIAQSLLSMVDNYAKVRYEAPQRAKLYSNLDSYAKLFAHWLRFIMQT